MAYPSDLVRTKNWGTETLTDSDLEGQFDLIIAWLDAFADETSGHKHDGSANEGPKIDTASIVADAIDGTLIADDACDSEHYTDGSIDAIHLAADIIDGTKIADDAVDSEHIAAGAIDDEHISTATKDRLVKAWVTFDGTAADPITKDDGFNIDGTISKTSTGKYTITWDTDFANANYCVIVSAWNATGQSRMAGAVTKATGSCTIELEDASGDFGDAASVNVIAIGDQ